jgi:hypothetical protein
MGESSWRVAHASAIGAAHENQNNECQDRLVCRILSVRGSNLLIAAIADGAGSTTDGQIGAEIACSTFVDTVSDFLTSTEASVDSISEEFGRRWVEFCRARIADKAAESNKEPRDFASTFVGAVIGDKFGAFFQVGDGGCVFSVDGAPGSYEFAIEPTETEYVNVTEFLTDDDAAENLRFRLSEQRIADVVLFSDGIFAVAVDYTNNRPHEPFLVPMIAPLRNGVPLDGINEKLERFLSSPKINEKTDDDKTIILASRISAK